MTFGIWQSSFVEEVIPMFGWILIHIQQEQTWNVNKALPQAACQLFTWIVETQTQQMARRANLNLWRLSCCVDIFLHINNDPHPPLTYKTHTKCTNASTDLGSSNISVLSSLMMPVLKLRTKSTMKRVSETTLKMIHEGVFSSLKKVMPTGRMIKFPIINININRSQ